jgi:hypothetical protein
MKPTKEEKEIIKQFSHICRYKRQYNKWWQNEIENIILSLIDMVDEIKLKKYIKKRGYY